VSVSFRWAPFADHLPKRGEQRSLGVDLAKEKDFVVCTLMNEFGETWVLGRWRHTAWPDTERRIGQLAREHDALVVLDVGHGGGYGGVMYDYLERELGRGRVMGVRTGNLGMKEQLCETLVADVENRRLRVEKGELTPHLRHELTFFESHREVVGGAPRTRYHGPQGDGEDDHDDCVISFALANWGRVHGWEGPQDEVEDLSEYVKATDVLKRRTGWLNQPAGGGYYFPSGPGYGS